MRLFWGNIKLSPSIFFILIRFGPDESSTNRTPKLVIILSKAKAKGSTGASFNHISFKYTSLST